jgi:hypothetical protein
MRKDVQQALENAVAEFEKRQQAEQERLRELAKRPGFNGIPAVKYGALHEIKSPLTLQPGPAALTDGLTALQAIIANAISRKTVIAVN